MILYQKKKYISEVENEIESVKSIAINYLNGEQRIVLTSDEPYNQSSDLPQSLFIGNCITGETTNELLSDIGYKRGFQKVYNDLQNQGNILINVSNDHINDEGIDNYLIAYIFRYLSLFPLGAVNVHIFDNNANYLYKRLENSFSSEKSSDSSKRAITIHSTLNDITSFKDSVCDDIFKKLLQMPPIYFQYTKPTHRMRLI